MKSSILNITFDCADARSQALFWAAATGGTATEQDATPGHVEYTVVLPGAGVPRLYFTTVPERKLIKNRVHLDLVPNGDQASGVARIVALGATAAGGQPAGAGWIILADPEGNEFCLEPGTD
jgi:hypothetical protein